MRVDLAIGVITLLAAAVLTPGSAVREPSARPRVDRVEPAAAQPGAVVTAFGERLDRGRVMDVILGNPEGTVLTHIVEQSESAIRFRVPRSLAPGRYRIALALATRWGSDLVEQPVYLDVLGIT